MTKEYRAKIFKSGNSVALRLPKALGLKEGAEVVLREERQGFSVEPVEPERKKIDLTGIWGSVPDFPHIERIDFELRSLDWDGKLLKRD